MRIQIIDSSGSVTILAPTRVRACKEKDGTSRFIIFIDDIPKYFLNDRAEAINELTRRLLVDGYIDLTPYQVCCY